MKSAILFLLVSSASLSFGAELDCASADKDVITVDGLTDDWTDVSGVDGGGQDPGASFTIKCNLVGDKTLALLVDVRDNYFVRTARAAPGEDHLEISLGGKKLIVFPGDAGKIKDKVVPPKNVRVASALQTHGWAVELELPLAEVPGWKPGAPSIQLSARFFDCDSKAALKTERTVEVGGRIVFADADALLDSFLKDRGITRAQVFWDKPMALGHRAGARAVLAGRYLAVLSDGFLYFELPFRERKDLRDVRLVDLAGDGRDAVVMRYIERGGAGAPTKAGGAEGPVSGAREVLAVYRPLGDAQIARVFACEVAKSAGPSRVEDKVSFLKRGRATDILVEPGAVSGFSKDSYREAPAEDVIPILLPWADDRKARYQFAGDEYHRAQ